MVVSSELRDAQGTPTAGLEWSAPGQETASAAPSSLTGSGAALGFLGGKENWARTQKYRSVFQTAVKIQTARQMRRLQRQRAAFGCSGLVC